MQRTFLIKRIITVLGKIQMAKELGLLKKDEGGLEREGNWVKTKVKYGVAAET